MVSVSKNPQTGTLPKTELNPLLNPTLAAHMGRWAEVYFTSPPEKREEAVLGLLRQLELETSGETESAQSSDPTEVVPTEQFTEPEREARPAEPSPDGTAPISDEHEDEGATRCRACGHINPTDQKFCGMCGAGMQGAENDPVLSHLKAPVAEYQGFVGFTSSDRNPFERAWEPGEGPQFIPQYDRGSYRYRVYVGFALALIVGALVYMSWRSTQAGLGRSHTLPPPAPTEDAQPASQPQAPTVNEPAGHSNEGARSLPSAAANTEATPAQKLPETKHRDTPRTAAAPRGEDTEAAAPASPDNGSQELLIADNYLYGAQGKARDTSEAAKWLWRAVAKHNSTAAVSLADLYLRGNGVGKNCDQARLLLDAAARKGVSGAAERLRNLQAFGCP